MDPIISKVASQIGLSQPQLHQLLPSELTLWVDPYEVSYRIGEDGSICVLYQEAPVATSYGLLTCKNQMILGNSRCLIIDVLSLQLKLQRSRCNQTWRRSYSA